MPPPAKNRNHAANLRIHGRKSNNRSRNVGLDANLRSLAPDWNALIEDARQAGIPLFYAKSYMDIVVRVQAIAENTDIPAKSQAPLIQALENHQHYLSTANRSWSIQAKRNGRWTHAPPSETLRRIMKPS